MADSVNLGDLLRAQALQKMNKSQNRVKTETLLATLVEFANSGKSYTDHVETRFPTITASRLNALIRKNDVLAGRVWCVQNDENGVCIVNVKQAATTA